MEKEYYYFVKGFQSIIEIKNRKICISHDKCIEGKDLSYIIEGGETSYELFKKVELVDDDPNGTYKTMFLEIVKDMYNEVVKDGETVLEPTDDIAKLLIFWTGSKNFPTSIDNPIKITLDNHIDKKNLPESHTCFNQIIMPKYIDANGKTAKEIFKTKLEQAFKGSIGFDFAGGKPKLN